MFDHYNASYGYINKQWQCKMLLIFFFIRLTSSVLLMIHTQLLF